VCRPVLWARGSPSARSSIPRKPGRQVNVTMDAAVGVFLLALPFLIVGGVVATLTYVLGTPTVKKKK
jgi:hypothetical protein